MEVLSLVAISCNRDNRFSDSSTPGTPLPLKYAKYLKLSECGNTMLVDIINPWDTTRLLGKYVLYRDNETHPDEFKGYTPLRIPLQRVVLFSSVHASLLNDLQSSNAIRGVVDAEFIRNPKVNAALEKGKILDCGTYDCVNTEKIISLSPDCLLRPPYDNGAESLKLPDGIEMLKCADYLETNPLGRAEWIKLFGILFGKENIADSIFAETEREYLSLQQEVKVLDKKPSVIFDRIYGTSWDMPARKSTMGFFIEDSGAKNPFAYINKPGAVHLSPETVLQKASDADYWFIRYYGGSSPTLSSLKEESGYYSRLKPWKTGNVYISDTSTSRLFEDYAFHPQWLLEELIAIMHPTSSKARKHGYFRKISQ